MVIWKNIKSPRWQRQPYWKMAASWTMLTLSRGSWKLTFSFNPSIRKKKTVRNLVRLSTVTELIDLTQLIYRMHKNIPGEFSMTNASFVWFNIASINGQIHIFRLCWTMYIDQAYSSSSKLQNHTCETQCMIWLGLINLLTDFKTFFKYFF